jgi:hypothetical protein
MVVDLVCFLMGGVKFLPQVTDCFLFYYCLDLKTQQQTKNASG